MIYRVFAFLLLPLSVFGDIESPTGTILFDSNFDSNADMTLNSTGLGIAITPTANLHVNGNAIISTQLFVGGSAGSSNLNINGTFGMEPQTVSANITLGANSIVLVDSSSDNITLNLPYAGNVEGRVYNIKKISTSNSVWITATGNLIDDSSPIEMPNSSSLASIEVVSNGQHWYLLKANHLATTVASDNLVGWWKLDESSGNIAYDSSGLSNHATWQGSVVSFSTNSVTGVLGSGVEITDTSASPGLDVTSSSLPSGNQLTLSAWFKDNTASTAAGIFSHTWIVDGGYNLFHWTADQVYMAIANPGQVNTDTPSLTLNTWYHVVGTYDQQDIKIYLNGVFSNSTNSPNGGFTSGLLRMCNGLGSYDDLRIYNRALTPAEILALYQAR